MSKGRPGRPLTHQCGEWTWNHEHLLTKVELPLDTDPDGCHMWMGAISPGGPLYGARKNNQPQMTQASRLIYMAEYGEEIADKSLRRTCNNIYCVRPSHMEKVPNHRLGYKSASGRVLTQYRGRDHDAS